MVDVVKKVLVDLVHTRCLMNVLRKGEEVMHTIADTLTYWVPHLMHIKHNNIVMKLITISEDICYFSVTKIPYYSSKCFLLIKKDNSGLFRESMDTGKVKVCGREHYMTIWDM
nr:hypothetical protein [Tanacetum cinerariifolium]